MSRPKVLINILMYYLVMQLLVACAATPKDAPSFNAARAPEPDNKTALVYIYRAFAQPTAYNVKVLVNGQKIADLANEGFTWVMLNEGYYKIDIVWPAISAQADVKFDGNLKGGKTYFYEVKGVSRFDGLMSEMGSALFQVDDKDAEQRIQKCCRYVKSWGHSYYPYALTKKTTKPSPHPKNNGGGEPLNYRASFAGKTVSGQHIKKGFQFKDYFEEGGVLIEVRTNGKRKKGKWTLSDSGHLCIIWKNNEGCGQLIYKNDGSYSFTRNNTEIRRYSQFEKGNALE